MDKIFAGFAEDLRAEHVRAMLKILLMPVDC